MVSSEPSLGVIRARRETRDRLMIQSFLPMLKELRRVAETWIDEEFKDLEDEIRFVENYAPTISASQTVNEHRSSLIRIQTEELPKTLKELDGLIGLIEQQNFKSARQATAILKDKTAPIISIVFKLIGARDSLDIMANMIPISTQGDEEDR